MGPPSEERGRRDLLRIFQAGIAAVDPEKLVGDFLQSASEPGLRVEGGARSTNLLVVGAGKAAAAMAAGCEQAIGADRVRGLVIVPDGHVRHLAAIDVAEACHPIPDRRAVKATDEVCRLMQNATDGPILCLLSGGASSLLVRPTPPVTLEEKGRVTQLLLQSGVEIYGVNTVRKHLSSVKGGGLLRMASQRPLRTLLISDVVGDDPSTIGSGPTVPDPTTFADAEAVLGQTRIVGETPASIRDVLRRGHAGEIPETVKPGDPATREAYATVIGSNRMALRSAAIEATRLGYRAFVREDPLVGETNEAACRWHGEVERELRCLPPGRYCFLAGGETVVRVRGSGKGGRNQEVALALVPLIAGSGLAVLSAGTDGIDGPTDAAGAFVDGTSARRAEQRGFDASAFFQANDSYSFFERLGDLFRCGPTGTNVMDVKIAVVSTLSPASELLQD